MYSRTSTGMGGIEGLVVIRKYDRSISGKYNNSINSGPIYIKIGSKNQKNSVQFIYDSSQTYEQLYNQGTGLY